MKKALSTEKARQQLALVEFYKHIDKTQLLEALRAHPEEADGEESKWQAMARFLTLSGGKHPESLAVLCKHFRLSWKQVTDYYADYQRAKGSMALMNHLPKAMEDVAKDALNDRIVSCPKCAGEKKIENAKGKLINCRQCLGTGKVVTNADKDARAMTFKMAGVLNEGRPLVAIQQNITQTGLEENVVDVQKLLEE